MFELDVARIWTAHMRAPQVVGNGKKNKEVE